ncbi:hypothetical protein [Acetobacter estunensis]|uniref:hypothetical protein n=1 Tax=Acetobacter estunensis TaxID=104097 RepID=UPI001C2CDA90|nr:hypothetical protein [Acetobacter estunensis]MBV1835675.1 hypothetical protein [Acetobacter estunensis]MBV1836064.1 hypothetical protein [Acetobacter estunensis]
MVTRALGKRPARHDPRAPKLTRLSFMQRAAPLRLIRDHIDPAPLLLGNGTIGDCTSVGLANSFRAQSACGGFQVDVTTDEAVAFYSLSTGYVPDNPSTDQGGVELDVLATAARDGYALATQTLFPLWGTMEVADLNAARLCMAAFGPVYCGFLLSESDMWTTELGALASVWDTDVPAGRGDTTPGSAGGHCALLWDYTGTGDTDLVSILTWGTIQKATWRWVRSRMDEVHAIAWPQLKPASGMLNGQDWETLRAENAAYLANA